jgi:hypothetical protein
MTAAAVAAEDMSLKIIEDDDVAYSMDDPVEDKPLQTLMTVKQLTTWILETQGSGGLRPDAKSAEVYYFSDKVKA